MRTGQSQEISVSRSDYKAKIGGFATCLLIHLGLGRVSEELVFNCLYPHQPGPTLTGGVKVNLTCC